MLAELEGRCTHDARMCDDLVALYALTWWRSWVEALRAPSRKVAGSIPDGVIGIFSWTKSFSSHSATNSHDY
jgi:hypothetical protein